ncbi:MULTISPECIES: nucleotidyl transferase AbiEii/AbiGii toxin family protein [Cupriavidus]
MDKTYADTVRLLLTVAPDAFANDIFALKGGTGINLFVQDMPRLSVDLDIVYRPWQVPRDEALHAIDQELAAIEDRVGKLGLHTRRVGAKDQGDTKLIIESETSQVKIEVNVVFRGTVLPVERRPLCAKASDQLGVEFDVPILARDELYAGKLVAALDRQHPRDLFDVWQLHESGGITDGMVECFVIYLAGHNRPPHEVLFGSDKDIAGEYERAFVGMTDVPCSLEILLQARARLRHALPRRLTAAHRRFLVGLVRASPDWSLLQCPHAAELPALRWKLSNLETFLKRRPDDFAAQAATLETRLGAAEKTARQTGNR